MNALAWVCTDGGPLIVIPSELAVHWRGTSPPIGTDVPPEWSWGDGGIVCDYDRACDMLDTMRVGEFHYVWSVPVASGDALLLDGETSTTAMPWEDGIVLLRDAPIETAAEARAILTTLLPDAWRDATHELELREGRLLVFDAAYEGDPHAEQIEASGGVLDIPLPPGRYRVSLAAPGAPFDRLALMRLVLVEGVSSRDRPAPTDSGAKSTASRGQFEQ